MKKDFASIKNHIWDESANNPIESVKSLNITLLGFHIQLKTLQETLGVDCIPKEKLANKLNVDIPTPSMKADTLLNLLDRINVQLETKSQINKISNIMKWPENAVQFIVEKNP